MLRAARCPLRLVWAVVAVALIASSVGPVTAVADVLHLRDADAVAGTLKDIQGDHLLWQTEDGDVITVPLSRVARIAYTPKTGRTASSSGLSSSAPSASTGGADDASGPASGSTEQPPVVPPPPAPSNTPDATAGEETTPAGEGPSAESDRTAEDESPIEEETPWWFEHAFEESFHVAQIWTKRIEIGGRILKGNSDEDAVTLKTQFERQFDHRFIQWDLGGQYGQSAGVKIANRWFGNGTIDFFRGAEHWILFITTRNEFDEFQNLDYRGTLSGGLGYRFYNDAKRRLVARLGPAVTHEVFTDPVDRRTTPDLLAEFEWRWPVFERARFEHKTTLRPSVDDLGVFRLTADNGLLVPLDEQERWNLKLGFNLQYNSQPNPGRRREDYTAGFSLVYTRK